jgi:acyl carrier protein
MQDIEQIVKTYVLEEFLPGEDPSQLASTTPLISTGILDSLATLKLVAFLEERFSISIGAHEADSENLETLERIARLVATKTGTQVGA